MFQEIEKWLGDEFTMIKTKINDIFVSHSDLDARLKVIEEKLGLVKTEQPAEQPKAETTEKPVENPAPVVPDQPVQTPQQ